MHCLMVSLGQLSTRRPALQHQSMEWLVDKQCLHVTLKQEILQGWGGGWCLFAAFLLFHRVKNHSLYVSATRLVPQP